MKDDSTPNLPKTLLRLTGRAIHDFGMLQDGDRVLLALSGGKDSLSLLHALLHFSRCAPIHFEVAAVTLDPMIESFDPSPLIPYLATLKTPYFYERQPMEQLARDHMSNSSFCAFCSRIKRGVIYRVARDNNYNVIAMGQHLDDLAESFMMSAFHGGQIRTMKAHYLNDARDLRIIRPFVYVRERQTRDFSTAANLPVVQDSCPACFAMPTQRQHMKELLAGEERLNPRLFKNLLTTLKPVMSVGLDAALAHIGESQRQAG
ncbi:MAG: tRNA 2-thiocytidine biosynthesis protein TtcA [Gammaproteobacteria bacterium]|nr:tRNA 2-thiocytidine biosynthesis protein TtcA [Gammaproteobacteria bacterium]